MLHSNHDQFTRRLPPPVLSSSTDRGNAEFHHRRRCRRQRQRPLTSCLHFLLTSSIFTSGASLPLGIDPAPLNSFPTDLTTDDNSETTHVDSSNDDPYMNTKAANTEQLPPPNFLRWRSIQEVGFDENKTNDDWNITSNDYNNNSGVFVTFPSFGLRLGPVPSFLSSSSPSTISSSLPSSVGGDGGGEESSNTDIGEELSAAFHVKKSMLGLRFAIESYMNETFHRTFGEVVNGTNYTIGKFAFANVQDVKFVSECQFVGESDSGGVGAGEVGGGDGDGVELVRGLDEATTPSSTITVLVSGGQAFYTFGVGGWWMESIPTWDELYDLVISGVTGKEGDVMGGGGLASWIQNMTAKGDATSSSSTMAAVGDLSMFQKVERVEVIEGLTLAPTTSPVPNPAGSTEELIFDDADDNDVADVESEQYDAEEESSSTSSVGDDTEGETTNGQDSDENVNIPVILEANSSNGDNNDDATSYNAVIIASALAGLLVVSAVIGLFVYRIRRRMDVTACDKRGDGTKVVPMSMMSDEYDDFYNGYSNVYNSLFSAAGGAVVGGEATDDEEAATHVKGNGPNHVTDKVHSKMVLKATNSGAPKSAIVTASSGKDVEQSSQQDDSLVPQVGCATLAPSTRLLSLGFEANGMPRDIENGIRYGDTKKNFSLGSHNILQQNYRVSEAVSPNDLTNLNLLAHTGDNGAKDPMNVRDGREKTVNRSSTGVDVVHDNIEMAEDTRVKRVTFAADIVSEDVQVHDILDSINAAAAVKRQSLDLSQNDQIVDASNIIENDDDDNNPSEEANSSTREVKVAPGDEDTFSQHDILNTICEVVAGRTTQSSHEGAYHRVDPPGDDVFSVAKKGDPPGDDIFFSKDDATVETDVFSGLRNFPDDDGSSSTYGATPVGCGGNIIQQTKEFFLCKQVPLRVQQPQQLSSSSIKGKLRYISSSSMDSVNPKPYSINTPPIVSDDEYDSEIDLKEEEDDEDSTSAIVHRPWKGKWNMDPYTNQTSGQQRLMCSTPESSSNYDPDSDWDVSDAEMDFVVVDDDVFHARTLRSTDKDKSIS